MGRTEEALELIRTYRRERPSEELLVRRFEEFCLRHPDPLSRLTAEGHLTASAWLIRPSRQCFLLFHPKIGRWLQPGGHIEDGETVREACLREVREETGITDPRFAAAGIFDLDIHPIPGRPDEPAHFHYDVRFLVIGKAEPGKSRSAAADDQSGWFSPEQAAKLNTEASIHRMIEKWINPPKRNDCPR